MNGDFLRKKIENAGFQLVDVAKKLSITPQDLQSKLKSKDVKVSFLENLALSINKSVYYFFDDIEGEGFHNNIINETESSYKTLKNTSKYRVLNDVNSAISNDIFEIKSLMNIIEEQKNIINELKKHIDYYKERELFLEKNQSSIKKIEDKMDDLFLFFKEKKDKQ